MTFAPPQFRILTGIEPKPYRDREGGAIELTYSTSRRIKRRMEVMAGEFVEVEDVEPATIVETTTYETDAELRAGLESLKRQLGATKGSPG